VKINKITCNDCRFFVVTQSFFHRFGGIVKRMLKRTLIILAFLTCYAGSNFLFSQTVFWTENFEANPCTSGCDPSTVAWSTTNTGTNSGTANAWYSSCAENGNAATTCGSGCGSDESLHMGSTSLGDIGAAYDASQTTNKRVESPTINCSGKATIAVNFNYIMFGELGIDRASLRYYDGASWALVTNLAQTNCCGGACNGSRQGIWTAFSGALPVSADNNANVKIGFNWTNDGSSGLDPSFAVDDISVTYLTTLPVELLYFNAEKKGDGIKLSWLTASEINNDFFTVERSRDGINFVPLATIKGAGTSNVPIDYLFLDENPVGGVLYYRLRQTDFDGEESYSEIKSVNISNQGYINIDYTAVNSEVIYVYCSSSSDKPLSLTFYDMTGRKVYSTNAVCGTPVMVSKNIFSSGIYSVVLTDGEKTDVLKLFVE